MPLRQPSGAAIHSTGGKEPNILIENGAVTQVTVPFISARRSPSPGPGAYPAPPLRRCRLYSSKSTFLGTVWLELRIETNDFSRYNKIKGI